MTLVLDASAFFTDLIFEEEIITTPAVAGELLDTASKCRLEVLLSTGLRLQNPGETALATVREAAARTGDLAVLSATDIGVLALAVERGATIVTDDLALQNTALSLGITARPIHRKRARQITWRFRCAGCGRYYRSPGVCTVCGAQIRRKLK